MPVNLQSKIVDAVKAMERDGTLPAAVPKVKEEAPDVSKSSELARKMHVDYVRPAAAATVTAPEHERSEGKPLQRTHATYPTKQEFARGPIVEQPTAAPVKAATGRTIPRDTGPDKSKSTKEYKDLGIDNLVLTGHRGGAARDEVMRRGKASGKESMVILDQYGDVVANGQGSKHATGMTRRIQDIYEDPNEQIVVHHNHPSDRGLSTQDIAVAKKAGVTAIYAHAADGISYRVAWRPAAKVAYGGQTISKSSTRSTATSSRS